MVQQSSEGWLLSLQCHGSFVELKSLGAGAVGAEMGQALGGAPRRPGNLFIASFVCFWLTFKLASWQFHQLRGLAAGPDTGFLLLKYT